MKYKEITKEIKNYLNSTHIDKDGKEIRYFPWFGVYIFGIKNSEIKLISSVHIPDREIAFAMYNALCDNCSEYDEYALTVQYLRDGIMTTKIHIRDEEGYSKIDETEL